ncbi:MAG: sugar phosphate nucleotidyltransferase, partial [Sandaracinaceae bacterium]|nr:sugar phosphate nucleotidyltransferase [Sandaracinaceae bacterium]
IFDVMVVAQYRPHSLIEHLGAGGPWEMNRERSGGLRFYTPYLSRDQSGWFVGTADAVQQNFLFIKDRRPDLVLILSGDHIYRMNYRDLVAHHLAMRAECTVAAVEVPDNEKHRFGICQLAEDTRIVRFVEKPHEPIPGLGSMGIYVFNYDTLDRVLLEDHHRTDSSHDFGKDILPRMVEGGYRVYAWPYRGYWRDVGTLESYWEAHMDLVSDPPKYDLNDKGWLIHTRSENRPPARIAAGAIVADSLITHGCYIAPGACVERSVLSPGVRIESGAVVRESVLFTDCVVETNARIERSICDMKTRIGAGARVGSMDGTPPNRFVTIGKGSIVPPGFVMHPGSAFGPDVILSDLGDRKEALPGELIQTKRKPYEIK